jgi:predicted nucleic acid-binding protein
MASEGFVDTSIVVRYLTGDPPEMAERAAELLDGSVNLSVTDVVLAEAAYVLNSVYGVPRAIVVDHLIRLVRKPNVFVFGLDETLTISGLLLCRPSGRVSFADGLVWAAARSAGTQTVYSFDERFPTDGFQVRHSLE